MWKGLSLDKYKEVVSALLEEMLLTRRAAIADDLPRAKTELNSCVVY